jgi:MFS family permease
VAHFIASPLRDPSYRRIVIFHLYWLFAIGLGAPFFNAHLLKHMNWNFRGTALLGVLFSVVSIMTQRFWGKFVDRFGHRPVLLITILGIVQLPLFYAFCPWHLRWPIYLNSLLGGVFWAGFSLAIFNLSMHALPPGGRSGYVAVFAAFSGVTHFAGTTLGGWLASEIAGVSWEVWGLPVVNYQILFILTTMLRASALILAYRISEPHATRTREVFRLAFAEINRRMSAGYNSIPNPLSQAWRGSTAHRPELKTTADDRVNRESLV